MKWCLKTKTGEESTLSHNLRKTRIALMFAEHDRREDYERFLRGFNATLNAASRGSKQWLENMCINFHFKKDVKRAGAIDYNRLLTNMALFIGFKPWRRYFWITSGNFPFLPV